MDSAVAAALLLEQGFSVFAFFLLMAQLDPALEIRRAQAVAAQLAIPLRVIDLSLEFKKEVVDYFCQGYLRGTTPNPCVVCNPAIKCGRLATAVCPEYGDRLATGHYARITGDQAEGFRLLQGRDKGKDQSYFLCGLRREQLGRLLFPLGEMTKAQVCERAAKLGLDACHGRESQDICFLGRRSVADFLAARAGMDFVPGEIVDRDGLVLGVHHGLYHYTVGQRRGLGIPAPAPYYVLALDVERNRLVVGGEDELRRKRFAVTGVNWISGRSPVLPGEFLVKIRYRHPGAPALIDMVNDELVVDFREGQRAVTPGQFAVFYDGPEVVGCGEIRR